jgi:type I restriction enzyme R subunit
MTADFHVVPHIWVRLASAQRCSCRAYSQGDKRIGVIWHTQGSGKSLLMAFYAGQLVRHPGMENPTIVVITDRNDLDDQLFATFSMCRDLIR